MFSVNSTIKLNFSAIRELSDNAQKALEQTTDALLTEEKNAEVMPFKTGNLQNESTYPDYTNSDKGQTSIVSDTAYARRLYYHPEFNFNRTFNRSAGAKWHRYWQSGGTRENFCVETFAQKYRRLNKL